LEEKENVREGGAGPSPRCGLPRKRAAEASGASPPEQSPPKSARTVLRRSRRPARVTARGSERTRGSADTAGGASSGLVATLELHGLPKVTRSRFRAAFSGAPGALLVVGRVPEWLHGRLRGARGTSLPPRNFPRLPFTQAMLTGAVGGAGTDCVVEVEMEAPGYGLWRFSEFRARTAAWGSESQDCYEGRLIACCPAARGESAPTPSGVPPPRRAFILPDGPPYEILPEKPVKRPKRRAVSCILLSWYDSIS